MRQKIVEIIIVILCLISLALAAAIFARMTEDANEYRGRWAAEEIGRMRKLRHEQEIVIEAVDPNQTELCGLYGSAEPNEPEYYQIQATVSKDLPPGIYAIWASPGSEIVPFDILQALSPHGLST
jgi:hypothetical protein